MFLKWRLLVLKVVLTKVLRLMFVLWYLIDLIALESFLRLNLSRVGLMLALVGLWFLIVLECLLAGVFLQLGFFLKLIL